MRLEICQGASLVPSDVCLRGLTSGIWSGFPFQDGFPAPWTYYVHLGLGLLVPRRDY